ncbi:hypothetical protein K7X08_035748 [Anisodus acutangulus]|uniref:Uncharacterized protein n=1 Tax=Anisodus acutangulus TaxID=402998 RepID=A0A9Q1L7A0_9SOLA|nr:hypothetical protein K7X08_035748 [Anisodus acutangulus]
MQKTNIKGMLKWSTYKKGAYSGVSTLEVGKDPGLPEALRARMFALEDEVNMVMGQYLGVVEGVIFN